MFVPRGAHSISHAREYAHSNLGPPSLDPNSYTEVNVSLNFPQNREDGRRITHIWRRDLDATNVDFDDLFVIAERFFKTQI
jgi:hypothetical protein